MEKLNRMIAEAKAESAASWAVAQAEVVRETARGIYRHPQTLDQARIEAGRRGLHGTYQGIALFYARTAANQVVCL